MLIQVVIPSPQAGFADFIVLRCRYEAAVLRKWRSGDRLKVSHRPMDGAELLLV